MSLREEYRKKSYKNAIDAEQGRRKREEELVKIRKEKRQHNLLKKRWESAPVVDAPLPPLPLPSKARLDALIEGVWSHDYNRQLKATIEFRKMLTCSMNAGHAPPIDVVIKAGVIPCFVKFLGRINEPKLQFEAAWTLANVACGTSDNTLLVIECGAVPMLVHLLASPSQGVREQAASALGNIAADSPISRDVVLLNGALLPLLSLLNSESTISLVEPALSVLLKLIHFTDEEILTDACWAFSYLSEVVERVHHVIEVGVCPRLVELLQHSSYAILLPTIRTVGNIVAGDEAETQLVIDYQVLPRLHQLLTLNHQKTILREVCWTISNITAGNIAQVQHAVFVIKKEAAWAISNATNAGSNEQIRFLTNQGCIKPLCDLLSYPDPNVVAVCLEGLQNILMAGEADKEEEPYHGINIFAQRVNDCGGVDKIGMLQYHDNNDISDMAMKILDKFWKEDEMEDVNLQNTGDGNDCKQEFCFGIDQPNLPPGGFKFWSL